jgi:hypothetical protein
MSTYILQKDLPEAKAGTEYRNIMGVLCYKTDLVIPDCTHPDAPSFTKSILSFDVRRKIYLDDQEWFKLKEDAEYRIVKGYIYEDKKTVFTTENIVIAKSDGTICNLQDVYAIHFNKNLPKGIIIDIFKEALRIINYCDNGITMEQCIQCINHYIEYITQYGIKG